MMKRPLRWRPWLLLSLLGIGISTLVEGLAATRAMVRAFYVSTDGGASYTQTPVTLIIPPSF